MVLLADYSDLQTEFIAYASRATDAVWVAKVPNMIRLAEARLNRKLGVIETDAPLTGTVSSRVVSISALAIVEPIALFYLWNSTDEREIQQQSDGSFPYSGVNGPPSLWAIDGTNINFDRLLDQAYTFRFRYRQKFNLATTSTNWLLTEHPDIYLAACLIWGAGFNEDINGYSMWKGTLEEGIPEVRNTIAQRNKGTLRVDPALMGRHRSRGNLRYSME